jgi:hypothetical protein
MAEPKNAENGTAPKVPESVSYVESEKTPMPKPAAPKASGNDANNAGPTPKAKKAEKEEPDAPRSNAPDPKSDPEAIKDATSDSVQRNTVINRSHTVLFNDSQGNQVHTFHVASNGFVNNITESQLRSILDKAGYELADVIDD